MATERSCAWMCGPNDGSVQVPAVKWWLAISRDVLTNGYRRAALRRPPVSCHVTPTFSSPMARKPRL